MANYPVSVEDFIGHFEDLIELYTQRIKDLRHIAKKSHGNARTYREVKLGQAEELEQCIIEIQRIIDWFRNKRQHVPMGPRPVPGQISLFQTMSNRRTYRE